MGQDQSKPGGAGSDQNNNTNASAAATTTNNSSSPQQQQQQSLSDQQQQQQQQRPRIHHPREQPQPYQQKYPSKPPTTSGSASAGAASNSNNNNNNNQAPNDFSPRENNNHNQENNNNNNHHEEPQTPSRRQKGASAFKEALNETNRQHGLAQSEYTASGGGTKTKSNDTAGAASDDSGGKKRKNSGDGTTENNNNNNNNNNNEINRQSMTALPNNKSNASTTDQLSAPNHNNTNRSSSNAALPPFRDTTVMPAANSITQLPPQNNNNNNNTNNNTNEAESGDKRLQITSAMAAQNLSHFSPQNPSNTSNTFALQGMHGSIQFGGLISQSNAQGNNQYYAMSNVSNLGGQQQHAGFNSGGAVAASNVVDRNILNKNDMNNNNNMQNNNNNNNNMLTFNGTANTAALMMNKYEGSSEPNSPSGMNMMMNNLQQKQGVSSTSFEAVVSASLNNPGTPSPLHQQASFGSLHFGPHLLHQQAILQHGPDSFLAQQQRSLNNAAAAAPDSGSYNNNNNNSPFFTPHNAQSAQQLREACSSLRMLLRNATRELSEDERRAIKELYDSLPHEILTNNESKLQRERVAAMWKQAFSNPKFQDTFSEEFEKLSNNMQGALFASTDLRQQARALSGMITQAMSVLNNPPSLQSLLRVLGAKHGMYGVDQKHFSFMGSALTRTLQTVLNDKFTPELQQEWSRIYSMLAQAMVHAQKEHNSNTAMAAQFRRKALQLYLTNFSRHVSRLLATIRKRAPRSDILVLCEAWMNKSSPQQILNLRPLEYRNPYNIAATENFENSTASGRSSSRGGGSRSRAMSDFEDEDEDVVVGAGTSVLDEDGNPSRGAEFGGGGGDFLGVDKKKKSSNSTSTTTNKKAEEKDSQLKKITKKKLDENNNNNKKSSKTTKSLSEQKLGNDNGGQELYPSVTYDPSASLTVQNLTGITAAAATAAAEPLARFLTDVIENSLRAVDVDLLDQGAANCTPALLMWLRTSFGNISDKDIVKCLSHGFTTVMLHGTSANDPNVAWVDSHLQKGLTSGFHQLQTTIPFTPLVGPFAVMQIRVEEFRRLLKLNGKKMRFVVKEIDRLLTACLAACQCHRIQTEREDVEDVSNSVIIAAHVWQLVALSVMLNTTIQNLPEMPPLNITGLQLRGHGPSFRRDLPRLCIAIHQSSAASPVPRYSPADPYRIVGVSMSELNSLNLGTAGGQTLMSQEAYRSLKLEKALHRDGRLTSPPLVGNGLRITLPQLDWSTFTIENVSAVTRYEMVSHHHNTNTNKKGGNAPIERAPQLYSITLKVHSDREFPKPMIHGSSMQLASQSDDEGEDRIL